MDPAKERIRQPADAVAIPHEGTSVADSSYTAEAIRESRILLLRGFTMPPGSGDQLGHYRLDRLLGSGGMGDVYLAHDLLLERQVAIKFVSNQKTDDPSLARRLLKEAQGVAAIEHPNICPVFDAGTDDSGRPFIVMQYLEGQTLSEKLGAGPLPIKKAFEMCAQIADALAAAHDVGIVHRDLKPANIVLTPPISRRCSTSASRSSCRPASSCPSARRRPG